MVSSKRSTRQTSTMPSNRKKSQRFKRSRRLRDEDIGDEGDAMMTSGDFLIEDDEEIDEDEADLSAQEECDPYAGETAEEKRVRLAKDILSSVSAFERVDTNENYEHRREQKHGNTESSSSSSGESDDEDKDRVHNVLQRAAFKSKGMLRRKLATKIAAIGEFPSSCLRMLRGHKRSATGIALAVDERIAFSCSKDGSWISWDVESGSKISVVQTGGEKGGTDELSAIAVSDDARSVVVGGHDRIIRMFDVRSARQTHCLRHHKDSVTCLAFRRNSSQLFSGSLDRSVKVWDARNGDYVDTLFGHQAAVTSLRTLKQERVLSCGLDGSLRLFKVNEESQLVYRSPCTNMDAVAMLSESHFVSGAQDGSLALWRAAKKKPIVQVAHAHGDGAWISSIAACAFSDVFASGANDGLLRLWRVDGSDGVKLAPLTQLSVPGHLNALDFGASGNILSVAIGQEPRLGRWTVDKRARNGICLLSLREARKMTAQIVDDDEGEDNEIS